MVEEQQFRVIVSPPSRCPCVLRRLALLAVLFVSLAGCGERVPTVTTEVSPARDLEVAEEAWRNSGISSYEYNLMRSCFCDYPGPFHVTVRNGSVESVSTIECPNGEDVHLICETPSRRYPTSDGYTAGGLFYLIRDRIDDGRFAAAYDPVTGFPMSFYSDGEPGVIDDEYGFKVTKFRPIDE